MNDVSRKRVLVADPDEIVAFIASHVLSRYDFAVDTVTSADALRQHANGYDALVISACLATELGKEIEPAHTVILGEAIPGVNAFARLRKPLELDLLVATVNACAGRRT